MIDWIVAHAGLFTSVSATIATLTFLLSVIQSRKNARSAELRTWQAVALQSYLEKKGKSGASLSDLLQWYRSEASAAHASLDRADLSESTCRRILIELMDMRIVETMGGGIYRLQTVDAARDMISEMVTPMIDSMRLVGDQKLQKSIYAVIAKAPFAKSLDAVIVEAAENSGEPVDSIRTILAVEVGRKRLEIDKEGRLGFGSAAATGN
jgi:hypothetical protein